MQWIQTAYFLQGSKGYGQRGSEGMRHQRRTCKVSALCEMERFDAENAIVIVQQFFYIFTVRKIYINTAHRVDV